MKAFLKGLFLTIFITFLFLSITSLLLLIPIRNTLSKTSIKEMVSSVEVEKLIKEDPEFQESINETFEPLLEVADSLGISEDVIIKIIDSKEVKDLVGDTMGNLVDFIITGEDQKILNTENIESIVQNALNKINESGYYTFTKEQEKQILDVVKEEVVEYQDMIPDTSIIEDSFSKEDMETINIIRFILGGKLTTYLTITLIVSLLGVVCLSLKEAKFIKRIAITTLISSLIVLIVSLVSKYFITDISYIVNILTRPFNSMFTISLTLFILMIITLIVYKIIHKRCFIKEINQ